MKNSIQPILLRIESKLTDIKAPILDRLQPGMTEESVRNFFTGLDMPEEVFELYAWKDGTLVDGSERVGQTWFLPLGCFMSVRRAMTVYKKTAGIYEDWTLGEFPLFESRGGEYFLIDIDSQSNTKGMIFFHSASAVDYDIIISRYDSLETMLRSIEMCFDRRAYFFVDGLLETDFMLEREINKINNPKSDFWKLFK